ncbi:MAG: hypothetical protein M3O30_17535 [Planctomycetota bacterium]|nr:hypothetical protein [Planctomycetota bacterium]
MSIEWKFRPLGKWPREQTAAFNRKVHPFKSSGKYGDNNGGWTPGKITPVTTTYSDLERELIKLNAENPVIIEAGFRERDIRQDGMIYAGAPQPTFPGIILSFRAPKHGPLQFACDDCKHWEDNLRAIALTLERLRLADLYGVTKRGEQYTGWKALPPPPATTPLMTVEASASMISEIAGGSPVNDIIGSHERYRESYRRAASLLHPDATGEVQSAKWSKLQEAKIVLDQHFAGGNSTGVRS